MSTRAESVMSTTEQEALIGHPPLWREYYELTKPRVVALIVFTAIVGMFLATPGWVPLGVLLLGGLGRGARVAGGRGSLGEPTLAGVPASRLRSRAPSY